MTQENILKPIDLMIGDWVNYQYDDEHIKPVKVTGLWENGSIELTFNNGMSVMTNIGYVMPIPLTPEILEKNGFKQYGDGISYIYLNMGKKEGCGLHCMLQFDVDHFNGVVGETGWVNGFTDVHAGSSDFPTHFSHKFRFVYELQHALRLCGIEKEIIL